jgi:hypothetical protein
MGWSPGDGERWRCPWPRRPSVIQIPVQQAPPSRNGHAGNNVVPPVPPDNPAHLVYNCPTQGRSFPVAGPILNVESHFPQANADWPLYRGSGGGRNVSACAFRAVADTGRDAGGGRRLDVNPEYQPQMLPGIEWLPRGPALDHSPPVWAHAFFLGA